VRALEFLQMIVDMCPQLRRIDIDITTERDLCMSRIVMNEVIACQEVWRSDSIGLRANVKATVVGPDVDDEDE